MNENEISKIVVNAAFELHSSLGPGLLESAYQRSLSYLLIKKGLFVESEKPIPLFFEEVKLDCGYRLDILVEKKLLVEVKSVETLHEIHLAQVLTYLKIGGFKLGLLINFNVPHLKNGIRRVINGYIE